ncbi:LamG-like jellyroll fold domain-containing protein [Flammeovirga kamogawensis]|uniref:T9SS type A sorting domain-containing protein n=1 Tax=Flammeovirga kamogawensis TaxID=373891 RepID=A0ABX8H4K9_9BACT|nr:LamG-like jellyroll fold domain-containing protein [Flammeovirga kamogawensis]MBB6463137.1 hypothetical protein [Flammeovirga kamogawensis]QWG10371.1 T9SS type A sorting domain-containing protein [Flammeovirga kamogawensis]TRX63881.1 T9SS type A sorting domain-containing protein [Flammeovirga kamogawensis]
MKKLLLLLMFSLTGLVGISDTIHRSTNDDNDNPTTTLLMSTTSSKVELVDDFRDKDYKNTLFSKSLSWSNLKFNESHSNNGSIENAIIVTANNVIFNGKKGTELVGKGVVVFANIPEGLTAYAIIESNTEVHLKLNGIAANHVSTDDVSNIGVSFLNGAFIDATVNQIAYSNKSGIKVDYIDGFSSGNFPERDEGEGPSQPRVPIVEGIFAGEKKEIHDNGEYINFHIGAPILPYNIEKDYDIYREDDTSLTDGETIREGRLNMSFPYDVFYTTPTFTKSSFDVSKGYFSDKTAISWDIYSNRDVITSFKIYSRPFDINNEDDIENYKLLATVSGDTYFYDDPHVEGGVLYEYKVVAEGIAELDIRYTNYITGVGFRNPTATVSGNIAFEGGNPVENVIVRAEPQGGDIVLSAHSVVVDEDGYVESKVDVENISDDYTIQSWFRLSKNGEGTLFRVYDNTTFYELIYTKDGDSFEMVLRSPLLSDEIGYNLSNYLPTGAADGSGEDVLETFDNVMNQFNHISLVLPDNKTPQLYFNGRLLNNDYILNISPEKRDMVGIVVSNDTPDKVFTKFEGSDVNFRVGEGFNGNIDDVRFWSIPLTDQEVKKNYRRYLSGIEKGLEVYLRIDEGTGAYAYDLSKEGFSFHERHSFLNNATWTADAPTTSQLGIFGVTDAYGNYVIASIPYSGDGGSYAITPLFGVHEFDPGQQVVYLGKGAEVVNQLDFTDISSFIFRGIAYYDVRGNFEPLAKVENVTQIEEDGYNQYLVTVDGTKIRYNKGHYFENELGELYEYPKVYLDGANIFVDGTMVLDENKLPVVTGKDGFFEINVPIGNHFIEIRKEGHGLVHGGRFPVEGYHEFFEHIETPKSFIDTTRVTVVGRIVGGQIEAEKPIGFGFDGKVEYEYNAGTDEAYKDEVSSVNNLGTARITFDYLPYGADPSTGYLSTTYFTNAETGEYRAELLPLDYSINQTTGIVIPSNPSILILNGNEEISYSGYTREKTSEYGTETEGLQSEPYNFIQNFIYRAVPKLRAENQTYAYLVAPATDTEDKVPVYDQFAEYTIDLIAYEEYENIETGESFEVPVTDGQYIVNNNLALEGTDSFTKDPKQSNKTVYQFTAGLPQVTAPFRRSMAMRLRIKGIDYVANGILEEGIVLGGQPDGSQMFVTAAPDVPDIILRDPPGSGSSASIEEGTEISITESLTLGGSVGTEFNSKLSLGTTIEAGGGLAGPVIKTEITNDIEAGLSVSTSAENTDAVTKTYSFSQTISTSEDLVGADGDLYIGQSTNLQYGSYNKLMATDTLVKGIDNVEFVKYDEDGNTTTVFLNKQKAIYFNEEPSETFFIYSQKHILNTLIPEYESFVVGLENGTIDPEAPGVLKKRDYEQQIKLWQEIIQNNEKTKYLAFNDQEALKASILSSDRVLQGGAQFANFVNSQFSDNISIDYGVGGLDRSISTFTANANSVAWGVDVETSFAYTLGIEANDTGFELGMSASAGFSSAGATDLEQATSTTFSYTISDNDTDNYMSIDVVNAFDGNGPIFRTVAGRTSCPWEGATISNFYDHQNWEEGVIGAGGSELSIATQQIEKPQISADVVNLSNIPEDGQGIIELTLENATNADLNENVSFMLYIDNTTNPYNIISNIPAGGVALEVPHDQPVKYTVYFEKSKPDVYDYEDLTIVLESICEGSDLQHTIDVSLHYVPSCTKIEVQKPLDKWVMNASTAFNDDGSTNSMPIVLGDYSRNYNSFEKVRLEYRKSTSPTWSRLHTYYNDETAYNTAVDADEQKITLMDADNITFSWDIGADGLSDGDYDIRAISYCSNGTEYVSNVVSGKVDLNIPVAFGTPSPADGILSAGEDLRMQFSENVLYNSAISNIEIVGQTNDQEISHGTSVFFQGASNKVTLEKPSISTEAFTLEFWMRNLTTESSAVIFAQENGMDATLVGNTLTWTIQGSGPQSVSGSIATDGLFHHYVFVYDGDGTGTMRIYQDDTELGVTNTGAFAVQNINNLVFGGSDFKGNILDVRLWSKALSISEAYAKMYSTLLGSERGLQGYWPMNEGRDNVVNDKARNKHGYMNAEWDIRPKGTAYNFANNDYLTLDNVGFVQISDEMDLSLSFWVKMDQSQEATIFSNGKGDGTDVIEANGSANKWSVDVHTNGKLYLKNEGVSYELTGDIVDGQWHHVGLVLNRLGALKTYVDADLVSSNISNDISGFTGSRIFVGARGFRNNGVYEVDRHFTGQIDELRLWNLSRAKEQLDRDRFYEVNFSTTGLMLYLQMNEPDPVDGVAPTYYHMSNNEIVATSTSLMNAGTPNFDKDSPAIKPKRHLEMFAVNYIINEDEMIITPVISNWSALEGQVLDITVSRLFDEKGNRQASPITWTAYVRKNQVIWSVNNGLDFLSIQNYVGISKSFDITIENMGGTDQPFTIENVPTWLDITETTGTLAPDSKKVITASVNPSLSVGEYSTDLYLDTDYDYDEKIKFDLRVLENAPNWAVTASDYEYNMNVVGKIKVNAIFAEDEHTKIGAFVNNEARGEAHLVYDKNWDDYFLYLNVYSNVSSGEEVTFKIWDATTGRILDAEIDGNANLVFIQDKITGNKANPALFSNTNTMEQSFALNSGWTWISLSVDDNNLDNLDTLTKQLNLTTGDRIVEQAAFDIYDASVGWSGSITSNSGMSTVKMYKMKMSQANDLVISGEMVNVDSFSLSLQTGWNWLPYPVHNNLTVNDALAYYDASNGDVIKGHNTFAVYDEFSGWVGTLNFMKTGEGYMLLSNSTAQDFSYPKVISNARSSQATPTIAADFVHNAYEFNMSTVVEVPDGYSKVYVYNNEHHDVRGIGNVVEIDGRNLAFISVFANDGEKLNYSIHNGNSFENVGDEFEFTADEIYGDYQTPIQLGDVISANLQPVASSQFRVYPNPSSTNFNLEFELVLGTDYQVNVYTVDGRITESQEAQGNIGVNKVVIGDNYKTGMYVVEVITNQGIFTKRLIKR